MYLMLFAIGLITTIIMFTYIPVSFAALFVKVEWKPIHHTVTAKELGRG